MVAGSVCTLFLILPILVVILMSFGPGSSLMFPPSEYGLCWYLYFFAQRKWMVVLGMHKLRCAHQCWLDSLFIIPISVPAIITAVPSIYLCGPLGLMANSSALVIRNTVLLVSYCYLTVHAKLQGFDATWS